MSIHPTASISPSSQIDEGAVIGAGTEVGPFCHIGSEVVIGEGNKLASHVSIRGRTKIGSDNSFFPMSVIGCIPQDLKFRGEAGELEIGDRNQFRECASFHIGTEAGRMKTTIGSDNLFMANSHVAHDCVIGNKIVVANSCAIAGHVVVRDHAILGGLAGIHQFVEIGEYVMVGAGSMVAKDIPPFLLAQGDRARLRGVNLIGLKRNGFSNPDIKAVKAAYLQVLLGSDGTLRERIQEVDGSLRENESAGRLISFIEAAIEGKRGLTAADLASD